MSRPDFCYCQTPAGLLIWGALSDERTGLSFTIDAGPLHRILGFESRGTHDRILLSQIRDSPQPGRTGPRIYIPRQQGVAVIPPLTGFPSTNSELLVHVIYSPGTDLTANVSSIIAFSRCRGNNVSTELFRSNGCCTAACGNESTCHSTKGVPRASSVRCCLAASWRGFARITVRVARSLYSEGPHKWWYQVLVLIDAWLPTNTITTTTTAITAITVTSCVVCVVCDRRQSRTARVADATPSLCNLWHGHAGRVDIDSGPSRVCSTVLPDHGTRATSRNIRVCSALAKTRRCKTKICQLNRQAYTCLYICNT
jgi:hypothetical protein